MKTQPSLTGRLGRLSATRPWWVVLAWVVISASIVMLGNQVTPVSDYEDFRGVVESQEAASAEEQAFGTRGASEIVVIRSDEYVVSDPEFQAVADTIMGELGALDQFIVDVVYYYAAPDHPEFQQFVSADGHALLIPIQLVGNWNDYTDRYPEWETIINNSQAEGFFVGSVGDVGGGEISQIVAEDMQKEVSIGLPVALLVMVVVFGALVAAGLPLILGLVTIVVGSGLVTILGGSLYMSDIAFTLVTMIGLAVGIDYSLVLLERYREERKLGAAKLDAIERASGSAGKAVFFSGLTTVLALMGVFVVPMAEFQGMGVAMAVAVAVAVLAGLTLLPALTTLIGDWINFPRLGLIRRLRLQDANGGAGTYFENRSGMWGKLAQAVVERPKLYGGVVLAVLLGASIPILTMELGQPSMLDLPESRTLESYRVIAQDFSAGQDSPLSIVLEGDLATEENAQRILAALDPDPLYGPGSVVASDDGSVVVIHVPLTIDSFSPTAQSAVETLRNEVLPEMQLGDALVGGAPASVFDFNQLLTRSMPLVLGFVLTLCFLVMMLAFRSLAVPAVSVVLNLLSVGAAYGAIALVFQHGFMADLLGLKQVETIVNWLPIMLFCILFGLSMDYHVFILSRIREEWDRTGDVNTAIINGVDRTGKIITGAAVIMVAVFGSFTMSRMVEMQQIGFGLALAIFLDVTLIRSILLPASLKLLGEKAWWWPKALTWVPQIHVEGRAVADREVATQHHA